jgi:serine/threonine protein kinase
MNINGPRHRQAMLLSPRGVLLESGDEPALIARVAVDVAEAIAGCVSMGVAHRDITPHNFIKHCGRGYLTDFYIAKVTTLSRAPSGKARFLCSYACRVSLLVYLILSLDADVRLTF